MKTAIAALMLLLSAASTLAQVGTETGERLPQVTRTGVPIYPPAAWFARVGATVEAVVTVHDGQIVRIDVHSPAVRSQDRKIVDDKPRLTPYFVSAVSNNLMTWRFPADERAKFTVIYTYRVEGNETPAPERPTVLWELPTRVTITARPFKQPTT